MGACFTIVCYTLSVFVLSLIYLPLYLFYRPEWIKHIIWAINDVAKQKHV